MTPNELVFVSRNSHKIAEINQLLNQTPFEVVGLEAIFFDQDIEETAETIAGNAILKAKTIADGFAELNCFADDTGLEIEALGGQPGVYSARFAGEPPDSQKNIEKVLSLMAQQTNRKAQFKTVICLYFDHKQHLFEGIVAGKIIENGRGEGGFGYDSIFVPKGYDQTFAQMPAALKNQISHRAIAINKMIDFLTGHYF